MRSKKILTDFKFLFSVAIITFISCEIPPEEGTNYEKTTNATFITQTSQTPNPYESVENSTTKIIEGTWENFSSSSKSKWIFEGETLSKSGIYSFGEIGEPQHFSVKTVNDYTGGDNKYGQYLLLTTQNTEDERSIIYQIVKCSDTMLVLKSKGGHIIKLEK